MTRDEMQRIFKELRVAFPNFVPDDKDEATAKMNLWMVMFKDTGYESAEWAAMRCIESCTFPPTIADMKSYLGMGRTLQDRQAMLPFDETKIEYANEIHMQAVFERLMRDLNNG